MKYLVISTLPKDDEQVRKVTKELDERIKDKEILYYEDYTIKGCIGCNYCWLKTPGICAVKDDYEKFLIKYLQADRVLYITQAKLGFVSYKLKNMIDRVLPLATMYLKFENGQMRHYARYHKSLDVGILYIGEADRKYLSWWLKRTVDNLHFKSLGAYPVKDRKELYHALDNH